MSNHSSRKSSDASHQHISQTDTRDLAPGHQRTSADFRAQLAGFSLTTAEILYRMPDHPALIQTYVWQDYDVAPKFPKLSSFLRFWTDKLDGPLFRVTVANSALIRPAELKLIGAELRLN